MTTFQYDVKRKLGLHARPAALFATRVRESGANVSVTCEGKTVDASQMKNLLGLSIKSGDQFTVSIEGDDEEKLAAYLRSICEENL